MKLSILAVAVLSAVLWLGCGDGANPGGGGGGGGGVPIEKWMKENLNIETADSWCYGEDGKVFNNSGSGFVTLTPSQIQANCDIYGRLYTWEAAKKACQSIGMRLPTRKEWGALVTAAGGEKWAGKKLKSTSGWYNSEYTYVPDGNDPKGTDEFGFSALPGGYKAPSLEYYGAVGIMGYWWTATESDRDHAYSLTILYVDGVVDKDEDKAHGYSVRCVDN